MSVPVLSSLQNPRIKAAVGLRDAKSRREQGQFLVDGVREITRALSARLRPTTLFIPETWPRHAEDEALSALLPETTELLPVTSHVLERISFGQRGDIVAIFATPKRDLTSLELVGEAPLVVVLASVEKPGNVGAVIRSADGAGASAVIVADPVGDFENPNCIRASTGAVFHMPLAEGNASQVLRWLRERELTMIAATVDGPRLYTEVDWRGPAAMILGCEDRGLTDDWKGPDILRRRLPMLGLADSLNVSVAAGVLLYEAARQRGFAPPAR